jgi:TonB family protein
MTGRLTVGGSSENTQTLDLQTIAEQGISSHEGKLHVLEMNERMRGKLEIGEFVLLFQFVVPPPPRIVPVLPAAYKRNLWRNIDWPFANILLASMLFQFGSTLYVVNKEYPPEEVDIVEILNSFSDVKIERPEEKPEEPEEKPEEPEEKPQRVDESVSEPDDLPEPTTPEKKAQRKEMLTRQVTKQTVLKYLVSGSDGGQGIVGEITSEAARVSMDEAFSGAGIAVAGRSTTKSQGLIGDQVGAKAGIDRSKMRTDRKRVRSGRKKEKKVSGRLKVKTPSEQMGVGKLSVDKIQSTVRRRSRGLQGCYEVELKKDNSLSGLIKVRFTIAPSGRVSKSEVIQNTMGSKAVGSCITKQIRRWRFPKPEGGSLTIAFPFVFTPSS